jgi:hypothetical protein
MNCADFESHNCATCNSHQTVVVQENRRTYRLENQAGHLICKIKVDNCLIRQGKRCDYLIIDCVRNDVYLIELKGSRLLDAVEQLEATFDLYVERFQGKVFARAVLSKVSVPNLENNPKLLRFQRKLKKLNGDFKKSTNLLVEIINA